MSSIRSFKTAPPMGADVGFKFIVYGDMGLRPQAHSTARNVLKDVQDGYEFIFHHGDISYARGVVSQQYWYNLFSEYFERKMIILLVNIVSFPGLHMGSVAFSY